MENDFDVVGLGQCSLDHLAAADRFPEADAKCECSTLTVQGGGPVATALVALTRWGKQCAYAGRVGDDRYGDEIAAELRAAGLNTDELHVRPGAQSQFAFVLVEGATGHRTIFYCPPTGALLQPHEVNLDRVRRARLFYSDGRNIETALVLARAAREAGVPVMVDAGSLRDGMLELAALSDVFITSEPFARDLMGGPAPEAACRKLADLGPRWTGVTLGAEGYVACIEDHCVHHPAYDVTPVDTTGCGDVFHAGVAYGLLEGWSPERSFDFAAWAAARVSTAIGGRAAIPVVSDFRPR